VSPAKQVQFFPASKPATISVADRPARKLDPEEDENGVV
jgi:hypothetical protein